MTALFFTSEAPVNDHGAQAAMTGMIGMDIQCNVNPGLINHGLSIRGVLLQ